MSTATATAPVAVRPTMEETRDLLRHNLHAFFDGDESTRPRPIVIHGPPGIGKSAIVKSVTNRVAADLKEPIDLVDFRASLREPSMIMGIPVQREKGADWTFPGDSQLPRDGKGSPKKVLFLDELGDASEGTKKALYGLILDGYVGEYNLPKNTFIIAATNRPEDGTGTKPFGPAFANRLTHIEPELRNKEWLTWAFNEGNIHPHVRGFIAWKEDALYAPSKDPLENRRGYPTPRSWESVSKTMHRADKYNMPGELLEHAIFGDVGPMKEDFMGYRRWAHDLPNIRDMMLKGPITIPSKRDSEGLAKTFAIASIANSTLDKEYSNPDIARGWVKLSTELPESMAIASVIEAITAPANADVKVKQHRQKVAVAVLGTKEWQGFTKRHQAVVSAIAEGSK